MSLFSFLRKNKQETVSEDSAFYSRAEADPQTVRPRKRKTVTRAPVEAGTNAPVDPVLPEKKRARRRLVGAVALVLAVIIGLPMLLDSEPKPLPDDLTIEIPSRERPTTAPAPATLQVPSKTGMRATSAVPARNALDLKEEMVEMPPLSSLRMAETVAGAGPVEKTPVPQGNPAARPEAAIAATMRPPAEKSVVRPVPGVADKAGDKTAEPLVGRNSVEAATDGKSVGKSDARPDARSAARVLAQGRTQSKSEIWSEPKAIKGESRNEARSDPRPGTKADAVTEVKPESAGTKPAKFSVQVAALASSDKVSELRGKLKEAGIASYTQKVATDNGERIRIRIGPLSSKQDIDKLRARLAALGLNGTVIPAPL